MEISACVVGVNGQHVKDLQPVIDAFVQENCSKLNVSGVTRGFVWDARKLRNLSTDLLLWIFIATSVELKLDQILLPVLWMEKMSVQIPAKLVLNVFVLLVPTLQQELLV